VGLLLLGLSFLLPPGHGYECVRRKTKKKERRGLFIWCMLCVPLVRQKSVLMPLGDTGNVTCSDPVTFCTRHSFKSLRLPPPLHTSILYYFTIPFVTDCATLLLLFFNFLLLHILFLFFQFLRLGLG
jgi:hypothetical protein